MKILMMCVANSARSQLAEGIARKLFVSSVEVRSAGSQPTRVNPFALQALGEIGVNGANLSSKAVEDLAPEFVADLDFVVTLCAEEVCPRIVSSGERLHWPLNDPAGHGGSDEEQLLRFRQVRDVLQEKLTAFGRSHGILRE